MEPELLLAIFAKPKLFWVKNFRTYLEGEGQWYFLEIKFQEFIGVSIFINLIFEGSISLNRDQNFLSPTVFEPCHLLSLMFLYQKCLRQKVEILCPQYVTTKDQDVVTLKGKSDFRFPHMTMSDVCCDLSGSVSSPNLPISGTDLEYDITMIDTLVEVNIRIQAKYTNPISNLGSRAYR